MKKLLVMLLAALMVLPSFTACQKTPESPIVVNKNAENLVEKAAGDSGAGAGSLREQVLAPDVMDIETKTEHFSVVAHAEVKLPQTDTIPMILVKTGMFSQETVNRLWQILIGDRTMYRPHTDADRTKEELEQAIILLQSDINRIEHNEYYEENKALREAELSRLQELYKTAPDTYTPTVASPEIGEYTRSGNSEFHFTGVEATDNAGTTFYVCNDSWYESRDKNAIQNSVFLYQTQGYTGFAYGKASTTDIMAEDVIDNAKYPGLAMQPKQAVETVDRFLAELKVPMQIDRIQIYDNAPASGDMAQNAPDWCYLISCHRMVEEYECAAIFGYTGTPGGENEYSSAWTYEQLYFLVNDDGIVFVEWHSPLEIGEKKVDSCKLLPFSEIQSIFEKMMQVIWEYQSQECETLTCNITEVRLELMRVLEQGSTENGLLIPVWNFYGTRQRVFENGETDETLPGIMLSVNAVSGSIIDSSKGY